ncbi:MAG: glycosyltransferase family 2 protein [Flavobacteriales bacterium]|nr:glycosyltransferase family 2 protein [Flavobacteriales bacterium]
MDNHFDLSIIVPFYNSESSLESCLQSIDQNIKRSKKLNIETILVNDGSTDLSAAIAQKFGSFKIITLSKNHGRLHARKVAAQEAKSNTLLFIDSRVSIDFNIDLINDIPLTSIGQVDLRSNKYRSPFDTFLFLLRNKYYDNSWSNIGFTEITRENFDKIAKGTGLLLTNKTNFLNVQPDKYDKSISDDTLVFKEFLDHEWPLYKDNRLKGNYLQRTDLKSITDWIFLRGSKFADFYVLRTKKYRYHYLLSLLAIFFLLSSSIYAPDIFQACLIIFTIVYLGILVWLSENIGDFLRIIFPSVFLVLPFYAGITYKVLKSCLKST